MTDTVEEFAIRWSGRGDENQDTQLFWIELMQYVVGLSDATRRIRFETPCKTDADTSHDGFIDVWIPSASLLIEQKSSTVDLDKAEMRQGRMVTPIQQALGYARGLPYKDKPRYLMTCNFCEFRLYDLNEDPTCIKEPQWKIGLEEVPKCSNRAS